MPDKFKIATAILGAAFVWDMHVYRHKVRPAVKELSDSNDSLHEYTSALTELLEEAHARSNYLASIIDRHKIELTAFDEIAIVHPL